MIITQKAEKKIKELLNKEEYLRVKIAGGGCSGYRIGLEKEMNREVDDVMMMDKILYRIYVLVVVPKVCLILLAYEYLSFLVQNSKKKH